MFQAVEVIFLFLFGFNFCWCFDEAWRSYQIHSKLYNLEGKSVKWTNFVRYFITINFRVTSKERNGY